VGSLLALWIPRVDFYVKGLVLGGREMLPRIWGGGSKMIGSLLALWILWLEFYVKGPVL
jgi:hypothetical protein